MQAYCLDLRQRVAQALTEPGAQQVQVAARFCESVAFVGKLVRRQYQIGSLAGLPRLGRSAVVPERGRSGVASRPGAAAAGRHAGRGA